MFVVAGVLQVDGYQAYKTLAKRRGEEQIAPMRLAFCLAHARPSSSMSSSWTGSSEAVDSCQDRRVYRIEAKTAGESADTGSRYASRDSTHHGEN